MLRTLFIPFANAEKAHALLEATMNATWCNASLRREFLSFEPCETNHARDFPTSARKSFRVLKFAGNKSEPVSSVCGVLLPRALPSFRDLLRNKPLLSVAFERYRSLFSFSMFASLIVGQRFK